MILTIIQARLGSTRFPGKVFKEIIGKPMIFHMLDRVKRSNLVDELCVATSTNLKDDILAKKIEEYGIKVFRGSENDVLERFYNCANSFEEIPKIIIRLTSDCPLIDPGLIDDLISTFQNDMDYPDYISNSLNPTLPDGLDCEVFTYDALEKAFFNAKNDFEREHVTPYIYLNKSEFNVKNKTYSDNKSFMRWTVDFPEDFEFVTKVYEQLYPKFGTNFTYRDVYSLLDQNPNLLNINSKFIRNEKFIEQLNTFFQKNSTNEKKL